MKLEDSPASAMTPTNPSPTLLRKQQLSAKLSRQSSSASSTQRRNHYMSYQRRQSGLVTSSDFLNQHTPSNFAMPLLSGAMNEFFQATKVMEDEIMLPSRLRDMPVDGKTAASSLPLTASPIVVSRSARDGSRQYRPAQQLARALHIRPRRP